MVIGFLGKGGSGKTTVATRFTEALLREGRQVLAIDADHNMDLLFNLAADRAEGFPYLGEAGEAFAAAIGLAPRETYLRRLARGGLPTFSCAPADPFTARYAPEIRPGLRLMVAGPHTEAVQHGTVCSHVLAAPLKVYLPCLAVAEHEAVVIDSTAGMDMVGSGIVAGMDLVYIVTEPTVHATKTAKQIAAGLAWSGTPHVFVLNKVQYPTQVDDAAAWLGEAPLFVLSFSGDAEANAAIYQEMVRYAAAFAHERGGNAVRSARAVAAAQRGTAA